MAFNAYQLNMQDQNCSFQERMVQIRRNRNSGLGLSIKGGAEHRLPILISKIYKDQAADITGQLFVGDAILKVRSDEALPAIF